MASNLSVLLSQLNETLHSLDLTDLANHWINSSSEYYNEQKARGTIFPIQISLSLLLGLAPIFLVLARKTRKRVEKPSKFEVPVPDEAKPNWKGRRLTPADIYQPDDPAHIYCYCPATSQFLGKFPAHTKQDIDDAVERAKNAQISFYSDHEFGVKRRKVLRTLCEFILRNQETIARVACRDSGKTMVDASMGEIMVTLEKINWILANGERALQPSSRPGSSSLFMKYKKAEVRYEPLGVVGALVSWNYPFHNLLGPIVAAVFTGNAIVVKCSERVRWSSEYYISVVKAALKVCGVDENLVQLVCVWGKDGDLFSGHPGLSHLTFIGSRPVAQKVVAKAGEALTPVVVELGGKDAVVICEDYLKKKGVDKIASILMRGTFQSAGQNCIGIERVIVAGEAKYYEKLVETLSNKVAKLRIGSDIDQSEEIDMGALIMGGPKFDELERWISEAVDRGARLLQGGKRYVHPNYPQGHYFMPTLIVDVDPGCTLATNEVFGPVLTILRATSDDEAVELANSTSYGLGSSVFSTDFHHAEELTNRLKVGNVAINDFATFYVCQLPFGGVKGSGYGKFGGEEGLRGLCNEKSVCYDRTSLISTSIPSVVDYPIANGKKAWKFVAALNQGGYDHSWWQKCKAIWTLATS
ncbi:hypothetical protein KL911_002033 [Ogataea haglerorum]|uniref:uncharacterized protein n=1 Tax=Ogataea haglerorum TaxID=1937702 RepID=UPI001C8A1C8E|nr:uncharacterized protein KL911_002033 [Ogataea haglerorum]KAG7749012.1 hypothetical protein KL912_002074 [Ogataea haglerorum]KAG7754594.1 hypothetical protein KL911_002033 [Ogataea haglerorum]